jgi:hypothetical protein
MQRRGNAVVIVIVALAVILLIVGSIMPFILLATFLGPKIDKPTGSSPNGGCTIPNNYFVDTRLADNPDDVIKKLTEKYGDRIPKVEQNIREVLAMGKERSLNPAIVLAMWNGESSFRQDLLSSAFGYGNTDSGIISGTQVWDAQLKGIYGRLGDARDNKGYYTLPEGADMFTRLWFNYTTALKEAYKKAGNSWVEKTSVVINGRTYNDPVGDRMVILRLLVPDQLQCKVLTAGATYSGNGLSTCAGVTQRLLPVNKDPNGTPRVIIMHYLGGKGESGEVFTVDDMYNYSLRGLKGEESRVVYVHYVIGQDGRVEQHYPENRSVAGAMDYNQPTRDYGAGAISLQIENEGNFESRHKNLHYTNVQLQANINLVNCLMNKFSIEKKDVISHQEADRRNGVTGRRSDPGKEFMEKLQKGLK